MISDAFWRDRFARTPSVVGSRFTVGRSHFIIVGVAPAGVTGVHPEGRADLWIPYECSGPGVTAQL